MFLWLFARSGKQAAYANFVRIPVSASPFPALPVAGQQWLVGHSFT
jgi:hypothetical protein